MHRRWMAVLTVMFSALVLGAPVWSQTYPTRFIRVIVPFAPGGGSDLILRAAMPHMAQLLGHNLVLDNRPGAGTIIGAEIAARAVPDGYTLLLANTGTMAINPSMYAKLPYDPLSDFEPIMLMGAGPNVLVVNPSLPVNSVKELIAYAKSNHGKLSVASAGLGGAPHLAGELFKSMEGLDMVHIHYKGGVPATTDVLGGSVQVMFGGMGASLPFIRSGKLRALGVASVKRFRGLPDVPTIGETLKGYEASSWFGMFAPAGTPKLIIARLNAEFKKVMARSDVEDQLVQQGYEPHTSTPEELGAYVRSETAKWAKVIREARIPRQEK
jgi:tripartite-type tricarboxylate transporter receptor subunit TctC